MSNSDDLDFYNAGRILKETYQQVMAESGFIFKIVARIIGPVLLLWGVIFTFVISTSNGSGTSLLTNIVLFALLALIWLAMEGCILAYMRLRRELAAADIGWKQVWADLRQNAGRMALAGLTAWIGIWIGSQLCAFPGLFLLTPLSLLVVAYTSDRTLDYGTALNHVFNLIKGKHMAVFTGLFQVRLAASLICVIMVLIATMFVGSVLESLLDEPRLILAFLMVVVVACGATLYQMAFSICAFKSYELLRVLPHTDEPSAAEDGANDTAEDVEPDSPQAD